MQRRGNKRLSTRYSNSSLGQRDALDVLDDKKQRKQAPSLVAYVCGLVLVAIFCVFVLPVILTPSQKKELRKTQNEVAEYLKLQEAATPPPTTKTEKLPHPLVPKSHTLVPKSHPLIPKIEKQGDLSTKDTIVDVVPDDDDDDDNVSEDRGNKVGADDGKKEEEENKIPGNDNGDDNGNDNGDGRKSESDESAAASARMEAQSSRWVDGEKALKKKLQVLYDQQMKGKHLGVPVLTRYLGEDFPAYVGTPDSPMDVDEWRKSVAEKYEEMRLEEEEWKKEMAKLIAKRERNIGITTA